MSTSTPTLTSNQFLAAWVAELCQEFLDAAHQSGGDMVALFPAFTPDATGRDRLVTLLDDQGLTLEDMVISYDAETNIYELDWSALDFELATA